jgi:hypothetical protein
MDEGMVSVSAVSILGDAEADDEEAVLQTPLGGFWRGSSDSTGTLWKPFSSE